MKFYTFGVAAATAAILSLPTALLAQTQSELIGQPEPGAIGFQPSATDMMRSISWFEVYTLWFIIPITIFVLGLLIWVAVRYNEKANPIPTKTSHNTLIEIIWTLGPIVILVALAVPSFQLLSSQFDPPEEPALTVKTVGYQWYWGYEYQTENEISFDSNMLSEDEKERADLGKTNRAEYPRLLAVDNEMVVPVNKVVRLLVTSDPEGVLHAFAIPAFGVKIDAVPGRNNETWFKAEKEGLYYGQCSELCGVRHAYMPLAVRVVSQEQYDNWLSTAANDLDEANQNLMASIADQNQKTQVAQNK